MEEMQQIKGMLPDLMKGGIIGADVLMEVITSKSLNSMKYKVQKAKKKKKEENNQIQQLSQKLEEAQQQVEQMQGELKKSQQELERLNKKNLELEQHKIQLQYQVDNYKAQTERQYRTDWARLEERKVEIEEAQLHDGNPYNDKINYGK